jgi:hypothetical protein
MSEPILKPEIVAGLHEQLKPCPFCGSTAYQRDEDRHHIWIECDECQIGTLGHDCIEYGDDIFATIIAAKRVSERQFQKKNSTPKRTNTQANTLI